MSYADLGEGVLGSSLETLLEVSAHASVKVELISLVNNDVVNRSCNIYVNRRGTPRRIANADLTVRPGYRVSLEGPFTLQAGDKIQGMAEAGNAIEWTMHGDEER
jgi:hypothetical protein